MILEQHGIAFKVIEDRIFGFCEVEGYVDVTELRINKLMTWLGY